MSVLSYPAFLQLLSERKVDDWVLEYGAIRRRSDGCCPLTAVSPTHFPVTLAHWAAHNMGMDRDTTARIIAAADDRVGHDPQVRADLLAACGLTEREQ